MTLPFHKTDSNLYTRREIIAGAFKTLIAASILPAMPDLAEAAKPGRDFRAINIMNFIRAEEPREPMDLFTPVREQMKLIKAHQFPATWLLQYDALVEGPFVDFLKSEMPENHEVGIWFEMNRKICDDAGLAWRGIANWEWDYHVPVAYAIGYAPDERIKLADTAAATFKRVFGRDLKSVASWNLDAVSLARFADAHGVDAFGNCRDQLATDGFTIWGAPIAAYYPSRINAWSPALEPGNQIDVPMFRLLGQDPVYYYDNHIPYPDTMEPAWPSGQSEVFVDHFLDMIARRPSEAIAYAQLGQENSFGWETMGKGFAMQMEKLAQAVAEGDFVVETMGETGRRFKRAFRSTPMQAQVMTDDPFGHDDPAQRTVWHQSKYYRANLHYVGAEFYLRDLHLYNDRFPQPYLSDTAKEHGIEQRMLAALDGYHWIGDDVKKSLGRFAAVSADGAQTPLETNGKPDVSQTSSALRCVTALAGGGSLIATFREKEIEFELSGVSSQTRLAIVFEWSPKLSALTDASKSKLSYRFRDFDYAVTLSNATAAQTPTGASVIGEKPGALRLHFA